MGSEAMAGRPLLMWLLRMYYRQNHVDTAELDGTLSFDENMQLLRAKFGELATSSVYGALARKAARSRRGRGVQVAGEVVKD